MRNTEKEENIRNETKRKWINFLRIIGIASACLSLYFFLKINDSCHIELYSNGSNACCI